MIFDNEVTGVIASASATAYVPRKPHRRSFHAEAPRWQGRCPVLRGLSPPAPFSKSRSVPAPYRAAATSAVCRRRRRRGGGRHAERDQHRRAASGSRCIRDEAIWFARAYRPLTELTRLLDNLARGHRAVGSDGQMRPGDADQGAAGIFVLLGRRDVAVEGHRALRPDRGALAAQRRDHPLVPSRILANLGADIAIAAADDDANVARRARGHDTLGGQFRTRGDRARRARQWIRLRQFPAERQGIYAGMRLALGIMGGNETQVESRDTTCCVIQLV